MLHGGPALQDIWGYNRDVQFLASRGYAVLGVNFRGFPRRAERSSLIQHFRFRDYTMGGLTPNSTDGASPPFIGSGAGHRNQPVPHHRLLHLGWIRCATGECRRHFVEVSGAEDAGAQNAQAHGRFPGLVPEAMDDAALDECRLSRPHRNVLAVDPPGGCSRQAVDRLIPSVVMVGNRHPCVRLHGHLEKVEAAVGIVFAPKKAQLQADEAEWSLACASPANPVCAFRPARPRRQTVTCTRTKPCRGLPMRTSPIF
jgi:hypothetical protein